ncbi:hypothetical protein D3C71_1495610 [compost metagenome]
MNSCSAWVGAAWEAPETPPAMAERLRSVALANAARKPPSAEPDREAVADCSEPVAMPKEFTMLMDMPQRIRRAAHGCPCAAGCLPARD